MVKKYLFVIVNALLITNMVFAVEPSKKLPTFYLNTEGNAEIVSKEDYLNASYWIDTNGLEGFEPVGSKEEPKTLQVKGRGNYTWTGFEKKPYKLKLGEKLSLLGMPKHKHYTLLAHTDDNLSFLRNAVGFQLSRLAGMNWTPNDVPIELVINGDYKGIYFLTEQIKVDKNRVNITEMPDQATDDVTGGWIVEIDNYDTDPHVSLTEPGGFPIIFTYKSPEVLSSAQEEYLIDQMTQLNNTIYGDKNSDALGKILDLEQAAKFYIVQELMDDCESYHGSCYLYKDKGEDQKWKFGPVWDFGNAFQRGYKQKFIWDSQLFHQTWIGELYKHDAFIAQVKEEWKKLCDNGLASISTYIEDMASKCDEAAKRSFERWPQYGNSNMSKGMGVMLSRLNSSAQWLGEQWGYAAPLISQTTPIYIRGSFNNWSTSHELTQREDGVWIYDQISLAAGDQFKIGSEDWKTVDYGAFPGEEEITPNVEKRLMASGKNIKVPVELKGYKVIFNLTNETLLLTNEETPGGIEGTEYDLIDGESLIYTISGSRVESINAPGIYIVKKGSKRFKVIK